MWPLFCTGPFISGLEQGTMELLAVPQVEGKVTYQGVFITAANSRIKTLDDLRGRFFAFTDPVA